MALGLPLNEAWQGEEHQVCFGGRGIEGGFFPHMYVCISRCVVFDPVVGPSYPRFLAGFGFQTGFSVVGRWVSASPPWIWTRQHVYVDEACAAEDIRSSI